MSPMPQPDRKAILSDPLTAFSRYQRNPDENDIIALDGLGRKYRSLKQQYADIKDSTNIISRQIGKAKRNNEPVDQLIALMQTRSIQLKSIKTEITELENRIAGYFRTGQDAVPDRAAISSGMNCSRTDADPRPVSSEVSIRPLDDESSDWNSYVLHHPASSIYHRAEWKILLEQTYRLESHYLLARYSNGAVAGILPQIRLRSRIFGDFLVSMPYFMRGGAIADRPAVELRLMEAASDYASNEGIEHIEFRDEIARSEFTARTDKVHMVLQLPDSHEVLWGQFTSKLRSQIRRPEREYPSVHFGQAEYLDDFYRVYTRNMRDLGSPAHSKKLIRNILDIFPKNSWIVVIHLANKPVAAGLLLQHGNNMDIPLASTIREVNPLGINMLMYWEILKFSIDNGCTQFDFGRSSMDSGTYRFKQQWGAEPKQLYLHYWLNDGSEMPSLNPQNPKFAALIHLWKRLPVELTKRIGPLVVKNLP